MAKPHRSPKASFCDEFFKVYLPDQSSQRLRVPPDFVKNFNGIIPNKIILRDLGGKIWHVETEEEENGVFFKKGWQRFASDHSLELGNFIVFRCNRNSSFDVKIFGNNGCMKEEDLAYKCVNEETPTAEKTAIPVKNELEEVDTSPKPTRNFKRKYSEVNMKRSEKTGGTGSNAVSRRKSPRIGSKTIEQHGTFDSSEFSKPTNPHFVASIKPASFYRLNIPKDFLDKYGIKMEPEMVLRNQEGKLWPVTVTFSKNGQITLSKGWMDFQKENGLGYDDKCMFEFVFHRGRRLSREIQVRILHATKTKSPGTRQGGN
ncbi:putative B3 domain-containing protein At5g66980 [Actinidia eriantha]|uniref:putative B3 domain-containing protein At5g66980 n=1 Tax=Actinidia eriantha TaxID=165200 RepID=UPI002584010D|nr:putative B3 domain-containing protein At5g66980 [Actinidia eriantha]